MAATSASPSHPLFLLPFSHSLPSPALLPSPLSTSGHPTPPLFPTIFFLSLSAIKPTNKLPKPPSETTQNTHPKPPPENTPPLKRKSLLPGGATTPHLDRSAPCAPNPSILARNHRRNRYPPHPTRHLKLKIDGSGCRGSPTRTTPPVPFLPSFDLCDCLQETAAEEPPSFQVSRRL